MGMERPTNMPTVSPELAPKQTKPPAGEWSSTGPRYGSGASFFRRQDFLHAYLVDKMLALQIDQMHSLLVVCQMRAYPADHHHD
jgi:hypothetical protein